MSVSLGGQLSGIHLHVCVSGEANRDERIQGQLLDRVSA